MNLASYLEQYKGEMVELHLISGKNTIGTVASVNQISPVLILKDYLNDEVYVTISAIASFTTAH
jgi:hypothetical protein